MPWISYPEGINSLQAIDLGATFVFGSSDPQQSRLNFVAARYDLAGNFLGFKNVDGGLLQLCKTSRKILDAAYLFGRKYRQKCRVTVQNLLELANGEFYDLCKNELENFCKIFMKFFTDLQYQEAGQTTLYAIPVLILNEATPNRGANFILIIALRVVLEGVWVH